MYIPQTEINAILDVKIWRHRRTGNLYELMMVTNTDSESPEKFPVTVVYRDAIGRIWSRPFLTWKSSFEPTLLTTE